MMDPQRWRLDSVITVNHLPSEPTAAKPAPCYVPNVGILIC
ncbi:hypothetical protein METHPM2_110098 [Pseudomonas sp. PM2]